MPAIALRRSGAELGEAGPGVGHWGEKVGYAPASTAQMQRLVSLPLLGLSATPLLFKNLSAGNLTKVRLIRLRPQPKASCRRDLVVC